MIKETFLTNTGRYIIEYDVVLFYIRRKECR